MNTSDTYSSPTGQTASQDTPSALSKADICEFQQLIQEHCGVTLTDTEAWNRVTELVALYRMFLGPIREDSAIRDSL